LHRQKLNSEAIALAIENRRFRLNISYWSVASERQFFEAVLSEPLKTFLVTGTLRVVPDEDASFSQYWQTVESTPDAIPAINDDNVK